MQEPSTQPHAWSILLTAAGFVIVIAGMRAAEAILVPLLVAALLAIISASPVFWLQRKRVPGPIAVFLVVLGVLGLSLAFGALIGTSLQDFSKALPRYQTRLMEEIGPVIGWLHSMGIQLSEDTILQYIDPGASMRLVANMLSGLGKILTNTFLIVLTVIFILLEASSFRYKVQAAFGDPTGAFLQFSKLTTAINSYLGIKTLLSFGTGVMVTIWVAILGIDFPLVWGLLAFLLNYIPNLGSILSAVPAVLLGYIQFGLARALFVALGYVVINIIFGNVIEPKLMGRKLGLSTLVVFLSLVFWGWVWGPVGMLLSVPMTMIVKIALEGSETTRWMGILMDSEGAGTKPYQTFFARRTTLK
ncbi:MAG: membrane protein [Nitrospirales bacterium]|nr:MAG: membrane protein [Nitrospirales bacterium]